MIRPEPSPTLFRSPNDLALTRGAANAELPNFQLPPCGAVGCSGLLGGSHGKSTQRVPRIQSDRFFRSPESL
jgi:hypothetical protein